MMIYELRNCRSALSPPAGSMGRINWTDCFQQNQWLTDGFRSGHHQLEGRWLGEGVSSAVGSGPRQGLLNPPRDRSQEETLSRRARPHPAAPSGLNTTQCGHCLGPSWPSQPGGVQNPCGRGRYSNSHPCQQGPSEMLNLGKAQGTDRLSLSPLSWGRGTDVSLGRRNSLITCGCLPGGSELTVLEHFRKIEQRDCLSGRLELILILGERLKHMDSELPMLSF